MVSEGQLLGPSGLVIKVIEEEARKTYSHAEDVVRYMELKQGNNKDLELLFNIVHEFRETVGMRNHADCPSCVSSQDMRCFPYCMLTV